MDTLRRPAGCNRDTRQRVGFEARGEKREPMAYDFGEINHRDVDLVEMLRNRKFDGVKVPTWDLR